MKFTNKFLIVFILTIFSAGQVVSQTNLQWYHKSNGSSNGYIGQMLEFPNGDILVQGFNSGGDMDPGPDTVILNTTIFFARYTTSGTLVFCRPLSYNGAPNGNQTLASIDSQGNFYYVINPNAPVYDLDPAPGVGEFTPNDGNILVKFNSMGVFQWGVVYTPDFNIYRLKALSDNSVVVIGIHDYGAGDIDPGPGSMNINTTCWYDGFVAKFDSSGNFVNGKHFESTSGIYNSTFYLFELAVDANDNIFLSGTFEESFDADPGLGVFNINGNSINQDTESFLIKLDNNLDFVFANEIHPNLFWNRIVASPSGDCYIMGNFDQPVDVDPSSGVTILNTDPNFSSTYTAKFDGSGNFRWAKTMKTSLTYTGAASISHYVDDNNNLNFVLYLNSPIVSNSYGYPQLPNNGFTSPGQYMVQLDSSGNCIFALRYPELQNPLSLITDANHFFLTGRLWDPGDIQMGPGITPESPTVGNEFVLSYYSRDLSLNSILGTAFIDLNSNNIKDANENGIKNLITEINPGNYYISTDNLGNFGTYVSQGNYSIKIPNYPSVFNDPVPLVNTANFALSNQIDSANNFAFTLNMTEADIAIYLTPLSASRPGMNSTFNVTYTNEGALTQSGDVKILLDSNTTFVSSTVAPLLVTGQLIHWSFSNLNPLQSLNFNFNLNIDSTMMIGDSITTIAEISSIVGDTYLPNNFDSVVSVLTGSYDPNSKEVFPQGDISDEQAVAGTEFTYTINFQNTGNDTAFFVTILDTLSSSLDIGSLRIIASSHPYYFALYPGNLMEFKFNNILLPDSNINEPASHGFVKYKIKADSTLLPGDFIENHANIYFDYNQPVTTNTTLTNIVDFVGIQESELSLGATVYPNPFVNEFIVKLPNHIKEKIQYTLCDITGKVMCNYESFAGELKINVEKFSKGIYFLKIRKANENGFVKVVKM